jgi:hypothetical protein
VAALVAVIAGTVAAADPAPPREADWLGRLRRSREALEWSDADVRHDWRLQERLTDGRWRVVDPADETVCEGSDAECRAAFARLEADGTIPPLRGPAVLVLHGLGEGRGSMRPIAEHLRGAIDANVLLVGYASTNADIEAHGRSLDRVIAALPPASRISFVGHSLGNLVVRRWMSLAAPRDLDRVHRMVMLGPPNQGSELARQVAGVRFLAGLAEGAARDLVVDWPKVAPTLATPTCAFGIVAGGRGDHVGFSPLLGGDDDAIVRVDETWLDGADDFLLVPVHHAAMLRDKRVHRATERFLVEGRFEPEAADAPTGGDE